MCLKKNEIRVLITKLKKDLKHSCPNTVRKVYLHEKIKLLVEFLKSDSKKMQ